MKGLAEYLPEFGWEPIIITADLPGEPDPKFKVIQTSYFDIKRYWRSKLGLNPARIEAVSYKWGIINGFTRMFEYLISYPDEIKGWYSSALKAVNSIIQSNKVDAIISTYDPVASHLIAKELKNRWNIPWIADFRDPWTQQCNILKRIIERRLELVTINEADSLTIVSKPLAYGLRKLHKRQPIYVIPNGFDSKEMEFNSNRRLTDEFTITYTGTFRGRSMDLSGLFTAIRDLISEGTIDPSHLQVRLYGSPEGRLEELIKYYELQNVVRQNGFVPRSVSLEKQRESQILLLSNWNDDRAIGTYTGKLFEYLAAQRPILSLGKHGGVIEELLNETNAGKYLPTIKDIKEYLKECYLEYKSKGEVDYKGIITKINKYSHREMARKFSEVLEHSCIKYKRSRGNLNE